MPDRKRFYDEPDLQCLTTRIVAAGESAGRAWVRLDETLFYPEGGGQPADHGTIGAARVTDVVSAGDDVVHFVDRALAPGLVEIVLDGERLFDRHHLPTTSFHLGADYTAIEVAGAPPSREALRKLEREINAHLRENRSVTTRWVEAAELAALPVRSRGLPEGHRGAVRLVEIEGLDLNTCGGTHVSHLRQIQAIELLDADPARGGARIRFLAGGRVFASLERRREIEAALKARIGTAPEEFASVLEGWEAERKRLDRRVRVLEAQLAEGTAETLAAETATELCAVFEGAGPDALKTLASAILARRPDAVAVLVGEECFLVQAGAAGPPDVSALGARVRDLTGAKGGGRGKTFQGKGGQAPALDALKRALRGAS
jgi:alanyl-tRNA synthetase